MTFLATLVAINLITGCGTTKSYVATEQLLLSDAVDSSVAKLDFAPLSGRTVFLDTANVTTVRSKTGMGLVGSEYIIGAIREQMLVAGCRLCPDREKAEVIAELRVGAMGTDGHSVIVGIPETSQTSSIPLPGNAALPALPELSIAKRDSMSGGAKVAVFAYARETREAVWQSGVSQATSNATDTWVMGVGPNQKGSIHEHSETDDPARKTPAAAQISSVVADQAKHRTRRSVSSKAHGPSKAGSNPAVMR